MELRVQHMQAALAATSLRMGDRVALALPNGTDWVSLDLAALSLGLVVVPLYLHDSAVNMAFILGHSGARLAVFDTLARWQPLLPHAAELPALEHVWIRDAVGAEAAGSRRPGLKALAEVLARAPGAAFAPVPTPDSLATIIYTSGTTGRPKGVMLTHRALVWNAEAVGRIIPPRLDDVFLSCLPLAHAFERTIGYYLPMMGGSTVTYTRSIESLSDDFLAVRPTAFLAVPRLYERTYTAIRVRAAGNLLRRRLLDLTASLGWRRFEAGQGRNPPLVPWAKLAWLLLDRWVAGPVRARFGGRLRAAVSGGAPLPLDVARFLIGMGLPVVEGYGLTEAGPVVATNSLHDNLPGSSGRPLEGVEVNVTLEGELIVRTPARMAGYWGEPGLTAEALDMEGWLHTGDIVEIKDGRIFIRGRLKNVLVLATGEKVAPGQIEARIMQDLLFKQALVIGDGKPFLAAVAVLDKDEWRKFTAAHGLDVTDPNGKAAKRALLRRLAEHLREFAHHAQVRAVHLTLEPWTIDAGLLTPTLKVKRLPVERKFAREIAALYAGHPTFDPSPIRR